MNDDEQRIYDQPGIAALIMDLQSTTPLSRINIHEAVAVFARIQVLGWVLTPSTPSAINDAARAIMVAKAQRLDRA